MPFVTIDMLEGRSAEQKKELAEVLTREIARICKVEASSVFIVMHDLPKTNVAKAGKLSSEPE